MELIMDIIWDHLLLITDIYRRYVYFVITLLIITHLYVNQLELARFSCLVKHWHYTLHNLKQYNTHILLPVCMYMYTHTPFNICLSSSFFSEVCSYRSHPATGREMICTTISVFSGAWTSTVDKLTLMYCEMDGTSICPTLFLPA